MIRPLVTILLVFISPLALASKIAEVPIDDLFMHADVVVSVEIIAGSRIDPEDKECGYKYEGLVGDVYKGNIGKTLIFGRTDGIEIGGRYLVFLTMPGQEYVELASTNSISESYEDAVNKKCQSKWVMPMIMQGGAGALMLSPNYWEKWAEVWSSFVTLPDPPAGPFRPHTPVERPPSHANPIWIYEEDLNKYLKTLVGEQKSD